MFAKILKYALVLTFIIILASFCTWLITRWFMVKDPLPDSVIKVFSSIKVL